jgi:hypothetical protein
MKWAILGGLMLLGVSATQAEVLPERQRERDAAQVLIKHGIWPMVMLTALWAAAYCMLCPLCAVTAVRDGDTIRFCLTRGWSAYPPKLSVKANSPDGQPSARSGLVQCNNGISVNAASSRL